MPIYEYQCQACQSINEIQHRISDPSPEKCPSCAGGPLRKLISQTAFVLKGSGWYTDGYSSKPTTKSGSSDSKAAESKPDSTQKAVND